MTKKYWCPTCGDLTACDFAGIADLVPHREHCQTLTEIPVVEPLAVPEPTTWGESGGAEAVCSEYSSSPAGAGGVLDYVRVEDKWFETTASVYDSGEIIIHESTSGRPTGMNYRRCDIVAAINYVAGR